VETLAERARRALDLEPASPAELRRRAPGPRPLSFQQQRLWFLEQLEPGPPIYNVARALRLDGALDTAALGRAVDAVVQRHESLRTGIHAVDDEPRQVVAGPPDRLLVVESVEDTELSSRETKALARIRAEVRRPFDLARPPLVRFLLIRVCAERHFLALTMHHIASDAGSVSILLRDLAELYRSFASDSPARLPPLPVQYGDYAAWQRETLTDASLAGALADARRKLSGAPAVLELPADRPRPASPSFSGGRVEILLGPPEVERLTALARQARATLFMTLLAAFETLLSRHGGGGDVVVGSPISGRGRPEIEDLVGFFVNMLVFRSDFSGDPTVAEYVARVREDALEAFDRQDLPFEKLVESLQPERQTSHAPVFQVMFNFHGRTEPPPDLPGVSVCFEPVDNGTSQFDLTLIATETDAGVACVFVYNADIFDRATVESLAARYRTILDEFGRAPGKRLAEVEVLAPEEMAALLRESAPPGDEPTADSTVPRLLAGAPRREGAIVECDGLSRTARELAAAAGRVAGALGDRAIGEGSCVGVLLERSVRLPAALLGIWEAGAAYVPVSPDWPAARTDAILADAGVAAVVTERAHAAGAAREGRPVIVWEDLASEEPLPASRPKGASLPLPAAAAYVIYTSGSTGRPKGVVVEQRSVANVLEALRKVPGVGPEDVWLSVTSPVFDISVVELFLPLIAGARLVIASETEAADPAALARRIRESGATIMQATPATWRMLVSDGWEGKEDLKILSGGEALTWELAAELRRRGREVWNLYGPTETTVWSAVERVGERAPSRFVPIGKPLGRTSLFVVDARCRLAPPGATGELAIGGAGVARGYRGMPEETATRFVPNPFGSGRLYRSGDRIRRLPGGRLEFLGRLDDQMKLRGYRIEPAEVEAVLASHPSVRQAAVVLAGEGEARRLLAFVSGGDESDLPDLRALLRSRLPEAMIPAEILFVDRFPLTSGGKVDRRALAARARPPRREEIAGPRNATEEAVARVWQEVMRVERIGIDQNFFDLGGHSLLATRVLARLRGAFEMELPLRLMFEEPTIAGLAAEIARRSASREESVTGR